MSREPLRAARRALAVRFAVLVGLLLASGGLGLWLYVRSALLTAFDAAHDLAIQSLLENVDRSASPPVVNERGFREEFEEVRGSLGVTAAAIFDDRGALVARASVAGAPPLVADGPAREIVGSGERTVVVRREALKSPGASQTGGTIAVARDAVTIGREMSSLVRGLALLGPLVLLGALAVGWMTAGQALRPVRDAFERQRRFMAEASHELRTPLSVIRAQVEVELDRTPKTDDKRVRALEAVARRAAQMGRLVDDLLFLSRTDDSVLLPRRLPFSFDGLVDDVVTSFLPLAREHAATLEARLPADGLEINADPTQVERLVGILVDNALRHGKSPVVVTLTRESDSATLRVSDAGPGIPSELAPTIFDRFVRGEASGHGLGLAIAKSIVTVHRGEIALDGSPGQTGTTFVVRLPLDA